MTTGDELAEARQPRPTQRVDPGACALEITESRTSRVGAIGVRRALPGRGRRTVGPWCFVDHMGPARVDAQRGMDVAPHPHIGLQTVTWLVEGEALHRDSLGSEQVIRPGQLNLMTAGWGVTHSEEGSGSYGGTLHGVHLGVDLSLRPGTTTVPLRADFEHALVFLTGTAHVDGKMIEPGRLAYLGTSRTEIPLSVTEPTRSLLLGGVPFGETVLMWWNFVARTRDEIIEAHRAWMAADSRFGRVASTLPRIEMGPPPWI